MSDQEKAFVINNYGKKSAFASFLPGISGIHGIPVWCYYVNRGQCVATFGSENKDHAIMEFSPAHQCCQNVKRTGFRTFMRVDGKYFEAFAREKEPHYMAIYQNGLEIEETNEKHQMKTHVTYFTLPEEKVGALVRKVEITNLADQARELELLDGMPAFIPYGVSNEDLKTMGNLVKAWMQVEHLETKVPFYRTRASIVDTAAVTEVVEGNFSFGCTADGARLPAVVDPDVVFGYDLSMTTPVKFKKNGLQGVLGAEQVTQNQFPCSFYGIQRRLEPSESVVVYEVMGQVGNYAALQKFVSGRMDGAFFEQKLLRSRQLTEELCDKIDTHTACPDFDAYCRYTYMDNVLRGGFPIVLGGNKIFYVYSRKHGDLEREYNYFAMLPEFYTQGNGSYRDVNQNRRCDNFFTPYVGTENIKTFYNLLQLDGYNPLSIEKVTYVLPGETGEDIFASMPEADREKLRNALQKPFTPGHFFRVLEECRTQVSEEEAGELFNRVMEQAVSQMNGNFGEGYWSDHWTYNLDLLESYLNLYPEKEQELLTEESYTWFLSQVAIHKRAKRYEKTAGGIRQYHALNEESRRDTDCKLVKSDRGAGEVVFSSLMEKLVILCTTKFTALDAYGMGIEMEGGKPGWYDALNGLPGLLGSSMAETYELGRMLTYTLGAIEKYDINVNMISEAAWLLDEVTKVVNEEKEALQTRQEVVSYWNRINDLKESYWEKVYNGIEGSRVEKSAKELVSSLQLFREIVEIGIQKACSMEEGICPTYFAYDVTEYTEDEEGIHPLHFAVKKIPLFLEGPVRYLKLDHSMADKKKLYDSVKNSDLYDETLKMYKVNASLAEASFEVGRCKAFNPGWLENESIWLHMEYKYLLELLKSGMYQEFAEDFHRAAVPFLDPGVYGRSIYENSSFIVSSKNPNRNIHGKGFVARLSGSTVEFIHMWSLMMFGLHPFTVQQGELKLAFAPLLPSYLVGADKQVKAMFLGTVPVTYLLAEQKAYVPGEYTVDRMTVTYRDGRKEEVQGAALDAAGAQAVRKGEVAEMVVELR
ncbi:MAG: hypothetical protein LUI12_13755 [Clostridiales bacterium]|nr:hypothetical protein [Clostridiales bacterium]